MSAVAGSPGEFALASLNDSTDWLPLFGLADDPGFNITGTFVGTVSIQISNQTASSPSVTTRTRTSTVDSYTAPVGPRAVPRNAGRWWRAIMTAYTSGTAYVGVTAPNTPSGEPTSPTPQGTTNNPVGSEF